jgi:sugar transferase (PEP-CTERM/EpsH1 system associated)
VAKIRVVHILYSFGTGGLEKGIATLVRHSSAGFEHQILCLTTAGSSTRLLPAGLPVFEFRKRPGNSLISLWKLARAIRCLKPDVVHTRNWSGLDGVIAARLAGIRSIVHGEHGWDLEDVDGLRPRRLRIRRLLASWPLEYTCVSKAMETWLREGVGIRSSITQIYNGVDTHTYCPGGGVEVREALRVPRNAIVIGTVGRLDPIKDHPALFRAFEELRGAHGSYKLLVVGNGPERERLGSLAPRDALMLGDRQDVPTLMRAMDIFVLPSLNEGISNSILEAMATGVPVVATAVGGNSELLQDGVTGYLVPPSDPAALSARLRQYASSEELRRLHGEKAREAAIARFSVEAMVQKYEAVWRRVALTTAGSR